MAIQRKHAVYAALVVATIGGFEGLRTVAYRDSVGVPTICYGETLGVHMGDVSTKAACDAMLVKRVAEFDRSLAQCVPALDSLPSETRVAFVSWAYNVGVGAACHSTLVRKANAGDIAGACRELPRWSRAGPFPEALLGRRKKEEALCLSGIQ
jgi:lysozyme